MPYTSRPPRRDSNTGSGARRPGAAHFGGRSNSRGFSGGGGGNRRGPKKDYIHPSRFVKAARPVEQEAYVPVNTFDDFVVNPVLKKNIRDKGFINPSPIQDQTIPLGLDGKDVIGIANTGTGKTIAFLLPILNHLMKDKNSRALIVAPTRELAQQIEEERRILARSAGLYGALLIGGSSMGLQLRDLQRGVQVVVGTPGRIMDHMQRGSLNLSDFNMIVLDEVDRMLDMGFVNDVRTILGEASPERQSFFFSATLDNRVKDLIYTFTKEPITVSVKTGDTTDSVHQDIITYETQHDKIEQLHDILIKEEVAKVIVFDETQRSVEKLTRELQDRGFSVDELHGGKTQGQRKRALDRFKRNDVNVLVATDVAARGIDVADITHVINYTTPQSYDDYTHRIGRAGRAGRIGYALTFVTDDSRDRRESRPRY